MKLQQGENVIHEFQPEGQILAIWFFTKCLPATFVGSFFGILVPGILLSAWMNRSPSRPVGADGSSALIVAAVLVIFALILALTYSVYLRRTYVYYVTNQRCVFRGGILRKVERSVHYHKVTDVEVSQNIIERVLGISTLKIFTPGSSGLPTFPFGGERAEITFVGMRDAETPAATINGILKNFRATGE
jgi:membrane protein YdbS with pleckstrin-like domain